MAGRTIEQGMPMPAFLRHERHGEGTLFAAQGLAKSFGGIHAVAEASIVVADRSLHALIGPNGAGKTTVFNLISGLFAPDRGRRFEHFTKRQVGHSVHHDQLHGGELPPTQDTDLLPFRSS